MIVTDAPHWWVREVWQGCKGPDVDRVHLLIGRLGYAAGCPYSDEDAAIVRGLQRTHGLEATGWVDGATAAVLQEQHDKRRRGE